MFNLANFYQKLFVIHLVYDPVIPYPNSVNVFIYLGCIPLAWDFHSKSLFDPGFSVPHWDECGAMLALRCY